MNIIILIIIYIILIHGLNFSYYTNRKIYGPKSFFVVPTYGNLCTFNYSWHSDFVILLSG